MSFAAAERLPPIWEMDMDPHNKSLASSSSQLMAWLQKHVRSAVTVTLASAPTATAASASATASNGTASTNNATTLATTLYQNLVKALIGLKIVDAPELEDNGHNDDDDDDNEDDDGDNGNNQSRRKKRRKAPIRRRLLIDPHKIWFQTINSPDSDKPAVQLNDANGTPLNGEIWDDNQDDIPETVGGKLSIISVGGLLNALSGQHVCHTSNANPKTLLKQAVLSGLTKVLTQTFGSGSNGVTILQLHAMATTLHMAIADQVKLDILRTTPQRIHMLLASDISPSEFASIRRRVYDTVVLGVRSNLSSDDPASADLPTAASGAVHDIEKYKKCNICGNNEQSDFILDRKNGDLICSHCGAVVSESIMHEGSQFRKFEGEVDRNHHGDAANPLYSNAHNMGTSLSGVAPTTGAGVGGWGSSGKGAASGGKRNLETILKNAHAYTELNVSQFGKTDRRTRIGYKDRQKKDAFLQMTHAGDALNLHEAVVQRAKELFAGFRDDRELIQQFKGVLAACLCEAFEQLSAEGKHLLRQQQQMQDQQEKQYAMANATSSADDNGKPKIVSARASRRSDLHHATLAGKGGLLLNKDPDKVESANNNSPIAGGGAAAANTANDEGTNGSINTEKPAAAWDLEDCRTWLLEASRTIANAWVEERKKNTAASKHIPNGPLGELEGQLVEHAIRLCEHLETELQTRSAAASSSSSNSKNGQQRVVTPRLTDMTKLGIKWQHAHERGSGGRGGVGGSGSATATAGAMSVTKNGVTGGNGTGHRTAGQILLLKTAKKLGVILNDAVAGEAIHKELRSVIGKQEALKQEEMRKEATRQRLNQMQRKPWLAARVQQ